MNQNYNSKKGNIKMGLTETGYEDVDIIHLVQHSIHWKDVVKSTINCRFPTEKNIL
jgi:hypothetical protein